MAELDKVLVELNTNFRKVIEEYGVEAKRRVEIRTPVGETGKLQRGWGFTKKKTSIEIYNTQDYASYVEYGTSKMAPRGMLRATLLEHDQILDVAAQKAGIKK